MNENYIRYAKLTVYDPDGQSLFVSDKDQRLQFEYLKNVKSTSNTLVVRVYGTLKEDSESALTRADSLQLEAGTGASYGVIFRGDVVDGFQTNGDRPYMQLTALDGDAFYNGFLSASVGRGESLAGLASICAARCSSPVTVGKISPVAAQTRLPRGCVLFGQAADIMDTLARQINGTWFVNDGRLYLLTEADMQFGGVIDIDAGGDLVGVPVVDAWSVTFGHHIDSRISLGAAVRFSNADAAVGVFRVVSISGIGDTHDGDWKMTVYALRQDQDSPAVSAKTKNVWR